MPALSARHIASSALCAALLVGITGPAVMAADSARERSHAASPDARLPREDALLAELREINWGELTPVADLLHAVHEADNSRLPAAEARALGDAAKAALAEAAAKAPATDVLPPAPTWGVAKPMISWSFVADPTSDAQDAVEAVEKALDSFLYSVTSDDVSLVPESIDGLVTEEENLVAALIDSDLVATTPLSTSTSTEVFSPPAVTLPAITLPTAVLPPTP